MNARNAFEIKFLNYNVHGIDDKLYNSDFINCLNPYGFVCLTETFASKDIEPTVFPLHRIYNCQGKKLSKQGRRSGGVVVLVRKTIDSYVKMIPVNTENVIVLKIDKDLFKTDKDIMYIATYIPPYNSKF